MSPSGPDALAWIKWFEADFRLSTGGWPLGARHAYRTLLFENWYRGQLPKDIAKLAELCELPLPQFERHWKSRIKAKFKGKGRWLTNPRIERDRAEAIRNREILIASGRKGGLARARGGGPQHIGADVSDLTERLRRPEK